MKRLVVTDADFPGFEHERWAAREAEAEFELLQCKSEEQAIQALAQVDVAIVQYAPITEAGLAAMRRGGAVVRYGIGHDNVDVEAASRHGISVECSRLWDRRSRRSHNGLDLVVAPSDPRL